MRCVDVLGELLWSEKMMEKPNCQREGCKNTALMFFADKWYCGECVTKWHNASNAQTNMEIEKANG